MYDELSRIGFRGNEEGELTLQGFPLGLNTVVPAEMISAKELAICEDIKINPGGRLETRKAFTKFTTVAATGKIISSVATIIAGVSRTIIADDDNKIYYLNGTVITLIGTAEGEAFLIPYNDTCLVADGSYLKYVDSIAKLKMAYDGGDNGVQFDNYNGDNDTELIVGNGTNSRVATKFTSEAWTAGYTIPITEVEVKLKATGSPTGAIACVLRAVSDDSVLATVNLGIDASEVSATLEEAVFTFAASDITTEMSPSTAYYCSIEHTGDAGNYISVLCETVATGGEGFHYASTTWTADTTCSPLMKIYPGKPPKVSFGTVSDNRPWLAGDPDNPGYVWYGNLTHLDFSTENGGGFIGVVDGNRNTFEVGGIEDLYGDLWVFGTQFQPYICKLTGDEPSNYSLPKTFQKSWTLPRTLVNVGNDLWSGSESGVDSLQGVEAYGDLRSFSEANRIKDKFDSYWGDTAFAGHYPIDHQYWIKLPEYPNILVANLNAKVTLEDNRVHYPWGEYTFPETVPSNFGQLGTSFCVGAENGHLYTFSSSEYKDLATEHILPGFKSAIIEFPYTSSDLEEVQLIGRARTGSKFLFDIYTNGDEYKKTLSLEKYFTVSDSITIEELDMAIEDMDFFMDLKAIPKNIPVNINCWGFQIQISDIYIYGNPVFFNGFFIKYKKMEQ